MFLTFDVQDGAFDVRSIYLQCKVFMLYLNITLPIYAKFLKSFIIQSTNCHQKSGIEKKMGIKDKHFNPLDLFIVGKNVIKLHSFYPPPMK